MGQCFLYGNGSGAGLRMVSGLTAPASPRENMVWVKSDKAGKKYVIAKTPPEGAADGLIWLVASNAGILTSVQVFTGAVWELADAFMYLQGAWVQFSFAILHLIKDGVPLVPFDAVAAEHSYANTSYVATKPTIAGSNDYYNFWIPSGCSGVLITQAPVSVNPAWTLHVTGYRSEGANDANTRVGLWPMHDVGYYMDEAIAVTVLPKWSVNTVTLPLSSLGAATAYVGFGMVGIGSNTTNRIKDLWLE